MRNAWIFKSHKLAFVLSVLTIALLLIILHLIGPFTYAGSDDFYLDLVASGNLTGSVTLRLLHLGSLPALLLAGLYSVFPQGTWYGLFLVLSMAGALSYMLYLTLCASKKRLGWAIYLVFIAIAALLCGQFFYQIQYTTVAGIVMCAALTHTILMPSCGSLRDFLRRNWTLLFWIALSYSIRSEAALMLMLPEAVLLMLYFFRCLTWNCDASSDPGSSKACDDRSLPAGSSIDQAGRSSDFARTDRMTAIYALVSILLLLGILTCVDAIAYHDADWQAFRAYNSARESIVDYDGYPDYDQNAATYEALGITRSSYTAAASHYALIEDPHWNAGAMETLAALQSSGILMICSSIFHDLTATDNRPCNLIALLLFGLLLMTGIVQMVSQHAMSGLIHSLAILCVHMILFGYLYLIGRHPYRVTQCIYLAEIFICFGLLCRFAAIHEGKTAQRLVIVALCLTLACILRFAPHRLTDTAATSTATLSYSANYEALRAYTDAHPDTLYLADTLSVTYFTKDALAAFSCENNFLPLGTWCAVSPWYDEVYAQYGISDLSTEAIGSDSIRFVVMDLGQDDPLKYLTDYYSEASGQTVTVEPTDTISCQDVSFLVYRLQ